MAKQQYQYTHTMEYNSAMKRIKKMIHETTRMNLQRNMLMEKIQSEEVASYMIPFI